MPAGPLRALAHPPTNCVAVYRGSSWEYADIFIDSFFVTDLVLNFFTPVILDGRKVSRHRVIAAYYLRHGFAFDLLCTFPYSAFIVGLSDQSLQVRALGHVCVISERSLTA